MCRARVEVLWLVERIETKADYSIEERMGERCGWWREGEERREREKGRRPDSATICMYIDGQVGAHAAPHLKEG